MTSVADHPAPVKSKRDYEPHWDQRRQKGQIRELYRLWNVMDAHRGHGALVRQMVITKVQRERPQELSEIPRANHWSNLLGLYTTGATVLDDGTVLELSNAEIARQIRCSPRYVKTMNRWLERIGWLHTDERRGVASFGGRARASFKSAQRCLSMIAFKFMGLWDAVKDKAAVWYRAAQECMRTVAPLDPTRPRERIKKGERAPRAPRGGFELPSLGRLLGRFSPAAKPLPKAPDYLPPWRMVAGAATPPQGDAAEIERMAWEMAERCRAKSAAWDAPPDDDIPF